MSDPMSAESGRKPSPDPTVATNDAVERAMKSERDYVDGKMEVVREELRSVDTQFQLVERQRVEQKKDTKDAVDAALAAAKEAVKEQTTASDRSITKSETATAEQLKQITATFTAANKGTDDKVDDLKTRIERIESAKQAAAEQRTETREGITFTQGLIATAAVLILFVLNAVGIAYSRSSSQDNPPDPVVVTVTEP